MGQNVSKRVLTIFTPTYNRAYILGELYESLRRQTCKFFEWLIVDDGSSDETERLVKSWMDGEVSIRYYKQVNGGKQRAHNKGVELCDTELFMCIDSDDYIVDNSVELLLNKWEIEKNNLEVAGILALRGTEELKPLGTDFPSGIKYSSWTRLYTQHGFRGDMTILHRTEILKKYPFWVAEGEKFIGEGYVYEKIDQIYTMSILPKVITICEYLQDGYTKNVRKLTKNNPVSYVELKRQTIVFAETWKDRYYHTILCIAGCIMSRKIKPFTVVPYKFLGILAYIPAWIVWFIVYRKA